MAPTPTRPRPRSRPPASPTPVALSLQYSNDHYGPSSADEYALIKDQLEKDGLFAVDLQTTEWVQYSKDRTADVYPAYQLGWFPDYSDADNYLTPFFLTENFLGNHYDNPAVNDMILEQATTADPDARTALIEDIQDAVAQDLSTVPLPPGRPGGRRRQGRDRHRGHPRRVVQVPLRRARRTADPCTQADGPVPRAHSGGGAVRHVRTARHQQGRNP